jgi:Peptidase M15
MNLTEHFTLEELCFSSIAMARHIDNSPPPAVSEALGTLAAGLEHIRAELGAPMHIDSGYRCPALNRAVRGVSTSAHTTGYAADFICPAFGSPAEIVRHLAYNTALKFDQLIQEGTWVHVSFDPKLRRQVLTAHFGAGKTTYTPGA